MLTEKDLQDLKEGWKIGFGDDDDFINLFFARYDSDDTRIIMRSDNDGQIVAQAHAFIFEDDVCGGKGCYIYGVTTLPEYRGLGLASAMIRNLLSDLLEKGIDYAVLIAESEELQKWYEMLGFVKREQIIEVKGKDDDMNFAMEDTSKNYGMYYIFNPSSTRFTSKLLIEESLAIVSQPMADTHCSLTLDSASRIPHS